MGLRSRSKSQWEGHAGMLLRCHTYPIFPFEFASKKYVKFCHAGMQLLTLEEELRFKLAHSWRRQGPHLTCRNCPAPKVKDVGHNLRTYLIIVIFFTLTQFLELKFYTQMRVYHFTMSAHSWCVKIHCV